MCLCIASHGEPVGTQPQHLTIESTDGLRPIEIVAPDLGDNARGSSVRLVRFRPIFASRTWRGRSLVEVCCDMAPVGLRRQPIFRAAERMESSAGGTLNLGSIWRSGAILLIT